MIRGVHIAFALAGLLISTPTPAARPDRPDCAASLPAVQAVVAGNCDCAAATSHGQYVRCAGAVVKGLVADGTLGRTCKGAMVRVFAKSSCGKADAVTCCVPRGTQTKCLVKKAAACEPRGGTPGATPFCADACVPASPSGAFID
jgi:hypothetical protein